VQEPVELAQSLPSTVTTTTDRHLTADPLFIETNTSAELEPAAPLLLARRHACRSHRVGGISVQRGAPELLVPELPHVRDSLLEWEPAPGAAHVRGRDDHDAAVWRQYQLCSTSTRHSCHDASMSLKYL
jgi:hypothetical protein